MDIVVKSRHHEVTDRFRRHALEKLSKIERLDERAISLTVELCEERNPRQSEQRDRIELTLNSPGPVVRAEAAAGDPYSALDIAVTKLEAQMRKAADRRKIHRNRKAVADSIKRIPPMAGLPCGSIWSGIAVAALLEGPHVPGDADDDVRSGGDPFFGDKEV